MAAPAALETGTPVGVVVSAAAVPTGFSMDSDWDCCGCTSEAVDVGVGNRWAEVAACARTAPGLSGSFDSCASATSDRSTPSKRRARPQQVRKQYVAFICLQL